jgi:hypothetical protein
MLSPQLQLRMRRLRRGAGGSSVVSAKDFLLASLHPSLRLRHPFEARLLASVSTSGAFSTIFTRTGAITFSFAFTDININNPVCVFGIGTPSLPNTILA